MALVRPEGAEGGASTGVERVRAVLGQLRLGGVGSAIAHTVRSGDESVHVRPRSPRLVYKRRASTWASGRSDAAPSRAYGCSIPTMSTGKKRPMCSLRHSNKSRLKLNISTGPN